MASSTPEFNNPIIPDPDFPELSDKTGNVIDLYSDPIYLKMFALYQQADFTKCREALAELEKRYPSDPELLKFKDELQMKLSLKTLAVKNNEMEKHKKRKVTLNMSGFAIIGTLIVMIVFIFSFYYLLDNNAGKQLEKDTAQLSVLNDQAEQLLLGGQPEPVIEIIAKMRSINVDFENLTELTSRTANLLQLKDKYQSALSLIAQNNKNDALVILKEIETEKPGMWDVSQQIAAIETSNQIDKYLEEGNAAYQVENWGEVINAYENALNLEPQLDDPEMKEQLLKAYLNMIIRMLQNDNASFEEVVIAEQYYRRAVAMIPQNQNFALERGDLQELSSNLLELKYAQTAKAMLEDKNQTLTSIVKAVSYMSIATNMDPNNTALQLDLKNAEAYQIAFQYFVEMNWLPAIINFDQILSADPNFAKGNTSLLLFEAYYSLGKQNYSAGNYQDARTNLGQAEILAWEDSENLMKLFQVQVLLGDTVGNMEDYQTAVSYYQSALEAIDVVPRLIDLPVINAKLSEAIDLAANGNYTDAFITYQEVLQDIDVVYTLSEIEINDGVCLAFFASEHLSTVDAVLEANNLPKTMVITLGRKLIVPMLEK